MVQIIFEVAKFIIEHHTEIERLLSIALGGVSNIKRVINLTDQPVEVSKVDVKRFQPRTQTMKIAPKSTYDGEIGIPWADNDRQYSEHHMTIKVGGQTIAYIWQNGPLIRFSTEDRWVEGAPGVSGQASASGGERTLVIGAKDGTFGFLVTGHQQG